MNCDKCHKPMEKVFQTLGKRSDDWPQYTDALVIQLGGGYGMFIDPIMHGPTKLVICKTCAEEFFVFNNWIDRELLT